MVPGTSEEPHRTGTGSMVPLPYKGNQDRNRNQEPGTKDRRQEMSNRKLSPRLHELPPGQPPRAASAGAAGDHRPARGRGTVKP
jgi:hypothetical protein